MTSPVSDCLQRFLDRTSSDGGSTQDADARRRSWEQAFERALRSGWIEGTRSDPARGLRVAAVASARRSDPVAGSGGRPGADPAEPPVPARRIARPGPKAASIAQSPPDGNRSVARPWFGGRAPAPTSGELRDPGAPVPEAMLPRLLLAEPFQAGPPPVTPFAPAAQPPLPSSCLATDARRAAAPPTASPAVVASGAGGRPESEPLRCHVEWAEEGVRVWLGVAREEALPLAAVTDAILRELRRTCEERGTKLLHVVRNGKTVWDCRASDPSPEGIVGPGQRDPDEL